MTKNRLIRSGVKILESQRNFGRQKNRSYVKKNTENQYITSPKSLEKHVFSWKNFAEYANEKNINRLSQVTPDLVQDYLQERADYGGRSGFGASEKTLKGYTTGINKVMLGAGLWEQGLEFSKLDIEVNRSNLGSMNKLENSKEWMDNHIDTYNSYQQAIDTIRAFGLRSNEFKNLNEKSFVYDSGNLYVQTVGKGGKYRVAECRDDMKSQMISTYKDYIHHENVQNLKSNAGNAEYVNDWSKSAPLKVKGYNSSRFPKHIFRSEYAQSMLEQKFEEYGDGQIRVAYSNAKIDYDDPDHTVIQKHMYENGNRWYEPVKEVATNDIQTSIGGYEGNLAAFRDVSENLGHNRLDVLLKYLK